MRAQTGSQMPRQGGGDSAKGVDGCGDTRVGCAENPAVVFDGTHANHVEVLPCGAGVAVPAVVGDVDEYVGTLLGEMADLVTEDGFVADEDAVGVAAGGEDGAVRAWLEGAYFVEEIFGEEEEFFEGDVLAEGNEVHLVIVADEGAVGIDEGGSVVRRVAGFIGRVRLEADVADDDGSLR